MPRTSKSKGTAKEKLEKLLAEHATVSPEQLYETGSFGGRNTVYDSCTKGEIECFRMGKRIFIPTAPLRRKLGLEA